MSATRSRQRQAAAVFGVITADLVESRGITERDAAQQRLRLAVDRLNVQFRRKLAAQFMITLGDEIQGMLRDLHDLPAAVTTIHEAFHPSEITVGIGTGSVTTQLARRASEMDGPAFVRSRMALEAAKKDELEVAVRTGDELLDGTLNAVYALMGGITSSWTRPQWQRVTLYRKLGKIDKVASALGVSKQSISKSLRNTHWMRVLRVERQLPEVFSSLGRLASGGLAAPSATTKSSRLG